MFEDKTITLVKIQDGPAYSCQLFFGRMLRILCQITFKNAKLYSCAESGVKPSARFTKS